MQGLLIHTGALPVVPRLDLLPEGIDPAKENGNAGLQNLFDLSFIED